MITISAGIYLIFFFFVHSKYIAVPKKISCKLIYSKSLKAILISDDNTHTAITNDSPKPHIADIIYFK